MNININTGMHIHHFFSPISDLLNQVRVTEQALCSHGCIPKYVGLKEVPKQYSKTVAMKCCILL